MASASSSPLLHNTRSNYNYNSPYNFKLKHGGPNSPCSSNSTSSSVDYYKQFINFSGMSNFNKKSNHRIQAMSSSTQGSVVMPNGVRKFSDNPDHLLVLVHGILASPNDWIYVEAELKRRLGSKFLIYASSSNTYTKTFGGIDGAGRRLAEEVKEVVHRTESLKRISFLAHSLGGLFARYAVALLYSSDASVDIQVEEHTNCNDQNQEKSTHSSVHGTIAGLDPINFITLATPHLGVRGKKQLPFLLGVPILEKLVPPIASIIVGRTGRQLFLTDGKPSKAPLLLRMTSDCDDGKFISSLGAFRCRTLYANVSYDHMVGWRTSSIRRETELVQPPQRSLVGYKHVVDVEYCPPVSSEAPHFPKEAARAKEEAQNSPSSQSTVEYHDIMEEEMIRGLQRVGWKKVDVSFHSALWPFFAHNNIHVKNEWFHNAGVGVISHVADSIKQQESSSSFIAASL